MNNTNLSDVDAAGTNRQHRSGEYPFSEDLHPDPGAGVNDWTQTHHAHSSPLTAFDVKDAHDRLQGWEDEDLKQIPVLPAGTRLEQGAVYINLRQPQPAEMMARGDLVAGDGDWYVPKSGVPYWLWNRLIGISNPERLDTAAER